MGYFFKNQREMKVKTITKQRMRKATQVGTRVQRLYTNQTLRKKWRD